MECICTRASGHSKSRTDRVALPFCHLRLNAAKPKASTYPKELKTWGDHIRAHRLERGLFQEEVAVQIGATEQTITNWELNHTTPEVRFLPSIIDFLGYVPYWPAHTFAEKLARARLYLGLSRKEMARMSGIDESNLAGWETGRHQPTESSLERIDRFFVSVYQKNGNIAMNGCIRS
jgi:transcriptional regulator with XRE-family HTH domain